MNRTVVIFSGLALLVHLAIGQASAIAQELNSARRNAVVKEAIDIEAIDAEDFDTVAESSVDPPKPEAVPELKSLPYTQEEEDQQPDIEPNTVKSFSPRDVLDLSTTGRVPDPTGDNDVPSMVDQVTGHTFKEVVIAGDQFFSQNNTIRRTFARAIRYRTQTTSSGGQVHASIFWQVVVIASELVASTTL